LAAPSEQSSLKSKIKKLLFLEGQWTVGRKLAVTPRRTDRRRMLLGLGSTIGLLPLHTRRALPADAPLRFALTPVLLTSDLVMLEELKAYLARATGRSVHLVTRRTYQEITALLVSRQVDAAWICGYPFVAFRDQLALVAVPVWRGKPLYQSYLIVRRDLEAKALADLAGTIHAFSDPDSNSGYLVTSAALAEMGSSPSKFFRQFFYTYGHRNVVRAVSSGLAASGSVDGYVYDVLRETEPDLVARTRIIRKSELLGFPPVACASIDAASPEISRLRESLVNMRADADGRRVLGMLRLDGFSVEKPELFDGIAAKMKLVRGVGE
jgi:phosphonate transport system substrate-binding protein